MFFWDLGTSKIRASTISHTGVIEESPLIAFHTDRYNSVLAYGNRVEGMEELQSVSCHIERCIENGVVANEEALLQCVLAMNSTLGSSILDEVFGKKALVAVPVLLGPGHLAVLQRVFDRAGFSPHFVSQPFCILDSFGRNPNDVSAQCMIDIGKGKTEFSVVSKGQIVAIGRSSFTSTAFEKLLGLAIAAEFDLQVSVGEITHFLQHVDGNTNLLRGKSRYGSGSGTARIDAQKLQELLFVQYTLFCQDISNFLEQIPAAYTSLLQRNGILLSGGGSLLTHLSDFICKELHVPVSVVSRPQRALILSMPAFVEKRANATLLFRSHEMLPILNAFCIE
ncbi:MAG TPA: rod shape-determining protein [Patescibacteria group bacterium]|nr:rod shape-determining protein [Patescibacteria group bacterium]